MVKTSYSFKKCKVLSEKSLGFIPHHPFPFQLLYTATIIITITTTHIFNDHPTHPRQYPAINLLQSWPLISLDTISCRAPSSLVISHCHHHFPPPTVIVIEDFRCNKTIGYYFSICNQTTKNKLFST